MPITDAQLAEYEERGAVTIDGPLTDRELDRVEAAWDRLRAARAAPYEEPDYLDALQHPFFEEVAARVLRAGAVHFWWSLGPHARAPAPPPFADPRDQWARGCHTDIQATWSDFTATPRRIRVELWFWLNEVPARRGAMRVLPGSHRPIMEYWDRALTDEHKAMLPRVHGLRPPPVPTEAPAFPEHVPDPEGTPWIEREPVACEARRGQVLVLCSGGLHSAWQNEDRVPRKAMLSPWVAKGVSCGLPKGQRDSLMALFPALAERLRPGRAHLVPDGFDWLFESDYEPKWPETFLPGHSA